MPYYRSNSPRSVYWLDDAADRHLLPDGCDEISEQTANDLLAPTLGDIRALRAVEIESAYRAAIAPVLDGYAREEIDSWGVQLAEAYLLADDAAAPITLLPAIAAERGITVAALATLVIEKAAQYSQVAGAAFARRRNRLAAIAAAETAEAIAGITW